MAVPEKSPAKFVTFTRSVRLAVCKTMQRCAVPYDKVRRLRLTPTESAGRTRPRLKFSDLTCLRHIGKRRKL